MEAELELKFREFFRLKLTEIQREIFSANRLVNKFIDSRKHEATQSLQLTHSFNLHLNVYLQVICFELLCLILRFFTVKFNQAYLKNYFPKIIGSSNLD